MLSGHAVMLIKKLIKKQATLWLKNDQKKTRASF
tara:strand:+ start:22683 stop:22784 length:102 start_codon:yes stop_codon:yes gene_type:complete